LGTGKALARTTSLVYKHVSIKHPEVLILRLLHAPILSGYPDKVNARVKVVEVSTIATGRGIGSRCVALMLLALR
jgi:hypothetical protein